MIYYKNNRKTRGLMVIMLLALVSFSSCLKEGDNSSILLNDPQDIPLITDFLPADLLQMFGEENVNFGDQPPVVDMEFVSNHEYVATSLEPPFAPPVGTITPIKHYHKINQHYLQIADYYSMSSEETTCHFLSPVYLTGYGNRFTVYYFEEPDTDAKPVHAVLFSGQVPLLAFAISCMATRLYVIMTVLCLLRCIPPIPFSFSRITMDLRKR